MILLAQSRNIKDYKEILEGLTDDFGYIYWHAILSWCGIIGDEDEKDSKEKYWEVYIIKEEGKTLGICGLYSLEKNNNTSMWLGWFGILPQYRSKGFGSEVLRALEIIAYKQGCVQLMTYIDKALKPLEFYKRNGFDIYGNVSDFLMETNYPKGEFEDLDDVVLVKNLMQAEVEKKVELVLREAMADVNKESTPLDVLMEKIYGRRTHWYAMPPQHFDIICPKCSGTNLAWSEFNQHIWCYNCNKDINDYISPMDGPVPIYTAQLLGFVFDIYDVDTDKTYKLQEFEQLTKERHEKNRN